MGQEAKLGERESARPYIGLAFDGSLLAVQLRLGALTDT